MPAAYFVSAGSSKADHFPITRELLCALAAWLRPSRHRLKQGAELFAFLHSAFGVSRDELRIAAAQWKLHCQVASGASRKSIPAPPARLPNLTDILSILHILLADEGGFGMRADSGHALKSATLRKARDQAATAIALGLRELHRQLPRYPDSPLLVDRFMDRSCGMVGPGDVLVTTNGDILLDQARDRAFGSTSGDYGTEAKLSGTVPDAEDRKACRPKLFKLHGSLNWLYCPRSGTSVRAMTVGALKS
jgi:hypothetical protein